MSSDQQQQPQTSTTTAATTTTIVPSTSPTNNGSGVEVQSEKPGHYTYLKEFRVEQCPNFIQHKCTQHKPYTCFRWHFQNQRRRRPVRRRDGTFNYSPDVYCTKYDETTGLCEDGDDCPYLHRTSGDTERRYHLRYYKTGICVYDTDPKGYCVKNGQHCAFAHGIHDLRNPVYDVRELQAMDGSGEGEFGGLNGPNPLDKERNALNEDPRWNESSYVLTNYKTELCKRPPRLCRQGYACPQYHNSKDKRRSPKKFKYRSTPCPNVKQGDEWGDPLNCEAGDNCSYCHTRTEQQFHPEIYKSTKCNDVLQTAYCPRGPFCAFAHGEKEMQNRHELMNEDNELKNFISNSNNNGGQSTSLGISRTMSCSSGSQSRAGIIASSLPDHYPGINALLSHQNNNSFAASKAASGGDSILSTPSASSHAGASLLGPGLTSSQSASNSLGAIGTRPRSYSTSASAAHVNHSMDHFFAKMKNARMEANQDQIHSNQDTSNGSEQRTNSSSGHRRSSGVFDTASSPLFPGRFGSNDPLGGIPSSSVQSSSRTITSLESYVNTAEQTVGSVVENALAGDVDSMGLDHHTLDDIDIFHNLSLSAKTTSSLVNGNDVLLDHHHPNQQQPHHLTHHSVHGLSSSSSRTDPVNIPGARLPSNDRGINVNNSTSSPPINASPSIASSFSHFSNSHQFALPSLSRNRTDTGVSVPHNTSQASSFMDSFMPSTSPQNQQLVHQAASILKNSEEIQKLKEELNLTRTTHDKMMQEARKAIELFQYQTEEAKRREKEAERERDEAMKRVILLEREVELLATSESRGRNLGLSSSPIGSCHQYHSLVESDLGSFSVNQLQQLKQQLKNDLDCIDKVLNHKSSLPTSSSSSSCLA